MLLRLPYSIVIGTSAVLAVLSGALAAGGMTSCDGPDCVAPYDFYDTQVNCVEVDRPPTGDCRWFSGLNFRMDEIVYRGRIAAYKIQWFNGLWSGWFVPGFNDFDAKFNIYVTKCSVPFPANGLRRVWSYFYDHTHKVIICNDAKTGSTLPPFIDKDQEALVQNHRL